MKRMIATIVVALSAFLLASLDINGLCAAAASAAQLEANQQSTSNLTAIILSLPKTAPHAKASVGITKKMRGTQDDSGTSKETQSQLITYSYVTNTLGPNDSPILAQVDQNGQYLDLFVNCCTNYTCYLQGSLDLINWTTIAVVTNLEIVTTVAQNANCSFYRLESSPVNYYIQLFTAPNGALPYVMYEIPEWTMYYGLIYTDTNVTSLAQIYSNSIMVALWQDAATNITTQWAGAQLTQTYPDGSGGFVQNSWTLYVNPGNTCLEFEANCAAQRLSRPQQKKYEYYDACGYLCDVPPAVTNEVPISIPDTNLLQSTTNTISTNTPTFKPQFGVPKSPPLSIGDPTPPTAIGTPLGPIVPNPNPMPLYSILPQGTDGSPHLPYSPIDQIPGNAPWIGNPGPNYTLPGSLKDCIWPILIYHPPYTPPQIDIP